MLLLLLALLLSLLLLFRNVVAENAVVVVVVHKRKKKNSSNITGSEKTGLSFVLFLFLFWELPVRKPERNLTEGIYCSQALIFSIGSTAPDNKRSNHRNILFINK